MNKIKFNGKESWFLPPDNKYGLSLYPMKNITNDDFSFLVKVKVYWDKMNPNDYSKEGGIIVKNGLHMGISAVKENVDNCYIKTTIWTNAESPQSNTSEKSLKNYDILLKVNCEDDNFSTEYNLCFSYKKKEKQFSISCNKQKITKFYEGKLLDYSNTWLWIGCSNAFDECIPEIRNFFYGEIKRLIICNKTFEINDLEKFFIGNDLNLDYQNIMCMFDFKDQTDYKVLDISKKGNHLMKYERSWF